jgi:hypothetical protein
MKRPTWIQQVYGYAVCLVAIITFLVSAGRVVDAVFMKLDPVRGAEERYGPSDAPLTSFEAFRAKTNEARLVPSPEGGKQPLSTDTLPTAELRRRYEALRADRIERVSYEANKQLVGRCLLLLLSAALFVTHWRWLRSREHAREDTREDARGAAPVA